MKSSTKQVIQESFRRLLLAKSLDKITVRDIVEDCGMTRNTFYYHYEDIYDLFDDYLETRMQLAWQSLPSGSSWDRILSQMISSVFDAPQMGRHIFSSRKRESMRLYLNKMLSSLIDRYIAENAYGLSVSPADRQLICDTCCHALYGLLEQWLTGPDAPLLQSKLCRVAKSFEQSVRHALEYCSKNPNEKEGRY